MPRRPLQHSKTRRWMTNISIVAFNSFDIGMMHPVNDPEHGNFMRGDMLAVNGQIKENNRYQDFQPDRPVDHIQKAPGIALGPEGGRNRDKATRSKIITICKIRFF